MRRKSGSRTGRFRRPPVNRLAVDQAAARFDLRAMERPRVLKAAQFPVRQPLLWVLSGSYQLSTGAGDGSTGSRRTDGDFAFAPDGVAADACPAGGFEIREELGERAFVFGEAGEAADGMALAGAAAAAVDFDVAPLPAGGAYSGGASANGGEIEGERAGTIELAESADVVAYAGEEDGEIRTGGDAAVVLQLDGERKSTRMRVAA